VPVRAADRAKAGPVSAPLYQLKAEFFRTLGHPARIRVLELLSEREHAVSEMLPRVGVEAAYLSQQLAVLRRAKLVVTRKQGSAVYYSVARPEVAALLRTAREILSGVLAGQAELLADLRGAAGQPAAAVTPPADRSGSTTRALNGGGTAVGRHGTPLEDARVKGRP
jgi:DNA-binding transcriptional ArsR family regulator